VFLGIQFLMWTLSGMYFSWTDIDEIHGDHFRRAQPEKPAFAQLLGTGQLGLEEPIATLELLDIGGQPFYWINDSALYHAGTGAPKSEVTREEALQVAGRYMLPELEVTGVRILQNVDGHHEYRGRPLPVYEISYRSPENLKAYVAVQNGAFQTVRHRNWRWFDFLWMTHTMDYQTRDDFNTTLLRVFSLMGLITVLSGFLLWYVSSPTMLSWRRRMNNNGRLPGDANKFNSDE
jgi:hypothetical protein